MPIVTNNLNDGPGSLRAAVAQGGDVTFDVGGVIALESTLDIKLPCVIDAENAPWPGITIIGYQTRVFSSDVTLRHLRFRGSTDDGLAVSSSVGPVSHIIIEHCSISWSADKLLQLWGTDVGDVTISDCIFAESLEWTRPDHEYRMALLVGDHAQNIKIARNLFVSNDKRQPGIFGDTSSIVVNNVIINPRVAAVHCQDSNDSGPLLASIVGNVVIPGRDTPDWLLAGLIEIDATIDPDSRIFLDDNAATVRNESGLDVFDGHPPVWNPALDVMPVGDVLPHVLETAGAYPRDHIDARIIEEANAGTARIVTTLDDVAEWPIQFNDNEDIMTIAQELRDAAARMREDAQRAADLAASLTAAAETLDEQAAKLEGIAEELA